MIKTEVDPGNVLSRDFTELERKNLPFATLQAVNATAFATREEWKRVMPRVFDRPTALTLNAVLYKKATRGTLAAEVFIRDEAFKGVPPSRYLQAQVSGGTRALKGFEKRLQAAGHLPAGMFAVPGRGVQLDSSGNIPRGVVTAVLSGLSAQQDKYQNVSEDSTRRRRARRKARGGEYFALSRRRGKLSPGVYERIKTGFGTAVRSVFAFVSRANYRERYDIFGLAERTYGRLFPFHFERELEKAVSTSKFRGKA